MAKRSGGKDSSATATAEGTPEAQEQAREREAAAAAEQAEEQRKAEEKREKEAARALELKGQQAAEAENPPTQKGHGEGAAYSVERLVADSTDFLGHPPHVVAGALAASGKEYLTVEEAHNAIDTWLGSEVSSGAAGEEG